MNTDYTLDGLGHQPVLYQFIIEALRPMRGGKYIDGTVGAGGHASGILEASSPDGLLLGLDLDPSAIELAHQRLQPFGERAVIVQASYTTMQDQVNSLGWGKVDGIIIDLGVSSMQLDQPTRGFSFRESAPLDMRFNPNNPLTAGMIVNDYPEEEISRIIWEYGEDRLSRRIAREIVNHRPIETTIQLAKIIADASGQKHQPIHPATRTFQALRIAVNDELKGLEKVIPLAINLLKVGGRLAIISFHSLEDRIVKTRFRIESKDCICPTDQIICTCNHKASIKEVTRKPIIPGNEEITQNPRARSAKLRIVEKL